MIFGSFNDVAMLRHIARELLHDIVEQEVLYYKLDLVNTEPNIYGESIRKAYFRPVRLVCLIKRGDQEWGMQDFGPDLNRTTSFAFLKEDMREANVLPEVGDIVEWDKSYYEVDVVKENQLFLGKDQEYRLDERTGRFGSSVSIVVQTHLTRESKIQLGEQ